MDNTTIIAEYLKKHFTVEQIKYNMYNADDIYYKIPTLSFSLADESYIDELKGHIELFQGKLKWTIFKSFYGKRRPNYLLCPLEVYHMNKEIFENGDLQSQKEYFSEEEYRRLCQYGIFRYSRIIQVYQEYIWGLRNICLIICKRNIIYRRAN